MKIAMAAQTGAKTFTSVNVFDVQMAAVATDVTSAVVKGSGHFVAEEHPEARVAQLLAFFDAIGA